MSGAPGHTPALRSTESDRDEEREVAEFQGLYGAYTVSETLLQKLWLRLEFDRRRARTEAGAAVQILHPGTWNRLAGPDFRGAKLVIGDRAVTGDVEVHFHADAWAQHGHHTDPAYDDVVLHVVLFPPRPDGPPARTRRGNEIPVLVLVDLLWHDLEEYASDDAVAALSGRDPFPLLEELLGKSPEKREDLVQSAATRRWREKVHFAARRIERLGWDEACHLTTLEILGYRSNRVAMFRVAERYPWSVWRSEAPDLDELVGVAADWWTLRGVRPANQPRRRLGQYLAWMRQLPDWTARARQWRPPPTGVGSAAGGDVAKMRKAMGLPRLREEIAAGLCGDALGGTRLDTWVINLLLPFAAVCHAADALESLWLAWYPGDAPELLLAAGRQLAPPGAAVVRSNGVVQGLLGLQLARMLSRH